MPIRRSPNPSLFPGMGRPRKLTYEAILLAAEQVMEEEGFRALSLRSLAQKLGVSSGTLYTYTNHIEDIEADVLKGMAATLPPPQSSTADTLREELIGFLHAARRLMARHPRVIFPPIGSAAWIAFSSLTIRWRDALSAFARSEADVVAAWAALISYSSHDAELERTWGADYDRQSAEAILKHFGRSFRAAPDQTAFDLIVESILNTMLPGLTRKGRKTARSAKQRLTEDPR